MKPWLNFIKRLLFTISAIVFTVSSFAQIPSYDQWHKGEIKLKDSSTYVGELKYDFRDDIVYFRKDNVDYIFHASFIDGFRVVKNDGLKKFTTLPHADKNKKKRYKIFQVIYPGTESEILAREYYMIYTNYTNIPSSLKSPKRNIEENIYYRDRIRIKTDYKYYISKPDEPIKEVKLTRTNVIKTFSDEKEKVKDFIVRNDLYFRRVNDLFKVVEFYHDLD